MAEPFEHLPPEFGADPAWSVPSGALRLCRLYSQWRRPVVFIGPVGTGKTFLARQLHEWSGRTGPFVAVGAGELDPNLFRDRLFGHARGAFTGASADRPGALAESAGGTLLLDDLALMERTVQATLLRVLESGQFRPLGASQDEEVSCRVVFATTVPPEELVSRGDLLPDLSSRLGRMVIETRPLRERTEEIGPLALRFARAFLREHGLSCSVRIPDDVRRLLESHPWPNNIRELRHVVERAVVHAVEGEREDIVLKAGHLPFSVRHPSNEGSLGREMPSDELIERTLEATGGNATETARILGIHRNTVGRRRRAGSGG